MFMIEESVIWDKIERVHRSRGNKYNKNQQSLQNLTTGSSQKQSKPDSSEQCHRYMFCKCIHQCQ